MVLAPSFPAVAGRVWTVPLGVRGTASLAPCPRPGCRLFCLRGLAAVCGLGTGSLAALPFGGDWLVSSGACPVTDAIALGGVWISPLVDRGAPPAPRGLSFAVRSGGRPCRAVFVWCYTTTHTHPRPGPTVPEPPPPLRGVRPHGVPPCLALLPSLCTRCRPRRVLCVASLAMPVVAVDGLAPASCSTLVFLRP